MFSNQFSKVSGSATIGSQSAATVVIGPLALDGGAADLCLRTITPAAGVTTPTAYKLQQSADGVTYTDVVSQTAGTAAGAVQSSFYTCIGKYVQVVSGAAYAVGTATLQLFGLQNSNQQWDNTGNRRPGLLDDGTLTLPSLSTASDPTTGWYKESDGVWAFAVKGTKVFSLSSSGPAEVGSLALADGSAAAPSLSFSSSASTGLYYSATGHLRVTAAGVDVIDFNTNGGPNLLLKNTAGGTSFIYQANADGLLSISSSTGSASGANIQMYGNTHATLANIINLRAGSTTQLSILADATVKAFSNSVQLGKNVAAEQNVIFCNVGSGSAVLSGGTGSASGGLITLYGASHATLANQVVISQGATAALTIGASQAATFAASVTATGTLISAAALSTQRLNVASTTTIASLSSAKSFVKLTGSTATDLQGIAAGIDGQQLEVWNATGQTLTIRNASASAASGAKITTCTGADITTTGNGYAAFVYDTDASPAVWICKFVSV